jgi:4'-phosphopantetheinyl transferase
VVHRAISATDAPSPPRLGEDEVHLWSANLEVPAAIVASLGSYLSADESDRAARFHFEHDRRRFTVSRAVLRIVLASYQGGEGRLLRFAYGPRGKPALDCVRQGSSIEFNLAHSQDVVLIAVAAGRPLGVDVEHIRPIADLEGVAAHVCSNTELRQLLEVPQAQRSEPFLRCWTRKEAYVKATGDGLSLPLPRVHVGCAPGGPLGVPGAQVDAPASERWLLYDLTPAPGCVGALAIQQRACQITRFGLDVERLAGDAAAGSQSAGPSALRPGGCVPDRSAVLPSTRWDR